MSEYNLNLFEDQLGAWDEIRWPPAEGYRMVYVVEEEVETAAGQRNTHGENSAWFGTGVCVARAAADGARLWCWELVPANGGHAARESTHPSLKASHAVGARGGISDAL